MKKKIIGLFFCMLMLIIVPISAGITVATEIEEQDPGVRTFHINGLVLFPHDSDNGFTFYYINGHEWITIPNIYFFMGVYRIGIFGVFGKMKGTIMIIE